jgi:hypothetical protein
VPLDRHTVEAVSGAHIRQLQQIRHVRESEKREIRKLHEQAAAKVEQRSRLTK